MQLALSCDSMPSPRFSTGFWTDLFASSLFFTVHFKRASMAAPEPKAEAPTRRLIPLREVEKAEDKLIYRNMYASPSAEGEPSLDALRQELEQAVAHDREAFYKAIAAPAKEKMKRCQALSTALQQQENRQAIQGLLLCSALMFTVPIIVLLIASSIAPRLGLNATLFGGFASVGTAVLIMAGYVVYAFYEDRDRPGDDLAQPSVKKVKED
eukprot:gene6126-4406_t